MAEAEKAEHASNLLFRFAPSCAPHHTGPLCQLCDGAAYIKIAQRCTLCGGSGQQQGAAGWQFALFAIGMGVALCLLFHTVLKWKNLRGKGPDLMLQASFMDW